MIFALLGLLNTAQAADLVIGAGASASYTCTAGQTVKVTGSSLKVTLSGDCGRVEVQGSTNTLTVDGVSALQLVGSKNVVTWKRNLSGVAVLPVTKTGAGNKVTQAQ